jgi:uncharacterized protein (TIGR02466 family)
MKVLCLFLVSSLISLFPLASGKVNDKYFLSKCNCADFGKPDCDFDSLSKKNLKILVEKLTTHRVLCVKSDEYFLPTFSASLFNTPFLSSSSASSSTKDMEKSCPPSKNETIVKTLPSDCKIEGLRCSTNKGVDYLFPTTLLTHNVIHDNIGRKYNEELKELLLSMEEEEEGCQYHLHGGYRSKDGFLHRKEPAVQWLRQQIVSRVQFLLSMANATDVEFEVDGWGAVLRGGDGQSAHVHPGSMYAGVYYVTVPKEVAESGKDGGCLEFMDPRPGAPMAQVLRGRNLYGDNFQICPNAEGGLMVIFPPYQMHEVKPMPSSYKGPRIGISFNVIYKPLFQMRAADLGTTNSNKIAGGKSSTKKSRSEL